MSTAFRSAPRPRRPSAARQSPLQPLPAKPRSVRGAPSGPSRPPPRAVPSPSAVPSAPAVTVKRLPTARKMPLWIRFLVQLHRGSLVVTFILVITALAVYGSTVYTQQLWSKEYRKLKTLTRNEREIAATTPCLENPLALSGTSGIGFSPPNTEQHHLSPA